MKLHMHKTFVGVHHFLHGNALGTVEYERGFLVIILVKLLIISF